MGVINPLLTGMILQVGSLQPRKHNSKTVHSKLPNCQINSMVSRKLNGSLNSSLLSEWSVNQVLLGWKTFHSQQNTKAKLHPHCVYAFFVGIIILAAVWHLPDWNPGDKTTARFCRNTFGQMAPSTLSYHIYLRPWESKLDNSNASCHGNLHF